MPTTIGFVATIEIETRNVSRVWFALTENPTGNKWVKIGLNRAWFTMNMESNDQSIHASQLSLIEEAMRSRLHVRVSHGGLASFHKEDPNDTFEVDGIRILRPGLQF